MENTDADRQKDDQGDGDLFYRSNKISKITDHNIMYISESKTWDLVKGAKPGRTLILKLIKSETSDNWLQKLFLKQYIGLWIRIPKHLVSLDEKYLRRCLKLIHMDATKGSACALSVNLSSLDMGFTSEYVTVSRRNSLDGTKYGIDYPVDVASGDLFRNSVDEGIVGSIMGSSSMMNILNNPLFQRLGVLDNDAGLGRSSLFENKRCIPCDYQGSPSMSAMSPSEHPENNTLTLRNRGYKCNFVQRSPISASSGISLPLDHEHDRSSPSSAPPSISRGMLQCTWENGIPCCSFSLDDGKELYVAKGWKIEVTSDMGLDYVYSFHLNSNNESSVIGKMKVSTSWSLCSSNSKVMETEFVLVGVDDNDPRKDYSLTRSNRRSRKLSKAMKMFRRTPSFFGGTSAIPEDFSTDNTLDLSSNLNLSENDFVPNLEMVAIVVKDHVQDVDQQKEEVGGWGLKFLKKVGVKKNVASLDVSTSQECVRDTGSCSMSMDMDIIVPAGFHGGPRTRNGGPSSLIERWRLGGQCDCGGWDIGCPLKVFKAKQSGEEGWPSSEAPGDCKSFDLFMEGSKQGILPVLKMVNIHDSLYFISFQSSSLSPLQCFSIAVAIVHSRCPTLRPKHVQH